MQIRKDISLSGVPFLEQVILYITAAFILVAPFYKGLFNSNSFIFEGPIFNAIFISSIILLLIGLNIYFSKKYMGREMLIGLIIWLIPLCYIFSFGYAASSFSNYKQLLIHCLYVIFFLAGLYSANQEKACKWLLNTILFTGYVLVVYSLMNYFRLVNFMGIDISYNDAVLDGRLSGVFQYPNTYGAYLLAVIFCTLNKLMYVKSRKLLFYSSMLFLSTYSVLLTLSVGTFVSFSAIVIVYFFFWTFRKQVMVLTSLLISLIISAVILNFTTYHDNTALFSLLIFIGGIISNLFCQYYSLSKLRSWVERESLQFKLSQIIKIPISILFLFLIILVSLFKKDNLLGLLPQTLQDRLINFQTSGTSFDFRMTFIHDSLKIFKDNLFFGAGGGAWEVLYGKYKEFPYDSTQTHNYFIQYLDEVGLIGVTIMTLVVGGILLLTIREMFIRLKYQIHMNYDILSFFMIIIAFLIHGIIDFDFSYVYVGVLTFLSLGVLSSFIRLKIDFKRLEIKLYQRIFAGLLCTISIILFVFTYREAIASESYKEFITTTQTSRNYSEIVKPLDYAIKLSLGNPTYIASKVNMLVQLFQQTKEEEYYYIGKDLVNNSMHNERYHRGLFEAKYNLEISYGNLEEVLKTLESGMKVYPWEISIYERLIAINYQLGSIDNNLDYFDRALQVFNQVKTRREFLDTLPYNKRYDSKNFKITDSMLLNIGKVYMEKGEFEEAETVLRSARKSNNFDNFLYLEIARFYLASLFLQEKEEEPLYNRLIEFEPSEAQVISDIVKKYSN